MISIKCAGQILALEASPIHWLANYLKERSIEDIYLLGLALDYCVKYSALDAGQLGLNTHVILDGCRGIELERGDIDRALDEMKRAGSVLLQSQDL